MKKGISRKKQPFAYAKRGGDGKWYHWRALAGKLAQGLALGAGFGLGKWLFGFIDLDEGFLEETITEIKSWFV